MKKPSNFFRLLLVAAITTGAFTASPRAQNAATDPLTLEERLERADAELERLQAQAGSVREQVGSLDEQVALVSESVAVAVALEEQLRAEIASIELRIEREEKVLHTVEETARSIAIEMYKGGATQELDWILSEESIPELDRALLITEIAAEERSDIMVMLGRLTANLEVDRRALDVKLAKAREVSAARRSRLQHLRELRAAQASKLADLSRLIEDQRAEASAIAARSQEVASILSTPPASGASAFGFAWPITGTITSGYGPRWGSMHSGIDIDCTTGATIRASKSGTVVTAAYDGGYGNHVVIDHGGGYATLYAHNSQLLVSQGASVSQGQPIAACGSTGQSTGDHLHFEVRVSGTPEDPMRYLP